MASTLGFGQLRQLWLQAGGDPAWADRMANIALRESRGNPGAQNLKYPDHSIGLWQINQLAHKGRYGNDQQLTNPLANARAAVAVFKAQGPTAWSTYNPAIDNKYLGPSTGGRVAGGKVVQTKTVKTPGLDMSGLRRDLIAQFVLSGGPNNTSALESLASGLSQAKDTPGSTRTVRRTTTVPRTVRATATGSVPKAGLVTFDGKPIGSWIAPILTYARQKGWTGKVISGYRDPAQQMQAARNYGLQHYGPGGPLASNHVTGNAVDVTNPQQLAQILKGYQGPKKLVWGGPVIGDTPHFSVNGH